MVQGTMASVRKKSWSTMRSKGTTSNIFSEQSDSEEARTYEEAWLMVPRDARMFCLYGQVNDCRLHLPKPTQWCLQAQQWSASLRRSVSSEDFQSAQRDSTWSKAETKSWLHQEVNARMEWQLKEWWHRGMDKPIKMDSNPAATHGKPGRCISHRCSVMSAAAMLTDWWEINNGPTA